MPAPAYNKSFTATKNLRALLASLSVPNIAAIAENLIAQILHYIHTTALALGGTLSVAGMTTLTGGLKHGVQALAAAGAVNLTTGATTIASAGVIALTLANGANGQVKIISMITDGGDATLTPANLQGGTTITFNDVGDIVSLIFIGTKWTIISNNGATLA